MFPAMLGLVKKGFKGIATGRAQQDLGLQSPHLPNAIVRIGRFLYVVTGGWLTLSWYTAYANVHTEPGSGPTIVLPGITGAKTKNDPSRPDPAVPSYGKGVNGGGSPGVTPTGPAGGLPPSTSRISGKPYGALSVERTDQGLDFGGAGPVGAIADGTVLRVGSWPGWPNAGGGPGLVYSTSYGNVYVMETFKALPGLKPGDKIVKGQVIGHALGPIPGSTGIETGFANQAGTGPLTPYGGRADGTAMPGGLAFRKLLGY